MRAGRSQWTTGIRLIFFLGILFLPSVGWTSLRVGNAELQVFYSQQHAFLYDNNTYGVEWAQFRNDLQFKFIYERLVENEMLFEQISIPHVARADFFAHYRGRFDPIYYIREKYRNLADKETRENLVFPENEFREMFLDMNFGQVGPGELSFRIGRQQIVWGESDLFRSLDIINPLRLDQNSLVGERFDDYRTPLWFIKFLYNVGTIGPFSDVGIEPFYGPNWQPVLSDVLLPGAFRLYDNDRPRFRGTSETAGGLAFSRKGGNFDKSIVRGSVPFAPARQGANQAHHAPAFVCLNSVNCAGQTRGDRVAGYFNFEYDNGGLAHAPHGWGLEKSMAGVRILGKTGFGVDFTLNYLFKRAEHTIYLDAEELLDRELSLATIGTVGPGRGILVPRLDRIYGAGIPGQDLATGVARCVGSEKSIKGIPGAPNGVLQSPFPGSTRKGGGQRIGNKGKQESAVLVGADLNGFNANRNREDDIGAGVSTVTNLLGLGGITDPIFNIVPLDNALIPITACGKLRVKYPWTHIAAFTMTYNDFDYTGAIFRLEQSLSSKEGRFKSPLIFRRLLNLANLPESQVRQAFKNNYTTYSPIYRSMVGFDLVRSLSSFPAMGWMKYAPMDMGTQITFFTFQFLTEYQFDNFSNNFPSSFICTGFELQNKCNRWNMAATFAISGNGYARGKFEPLLAVGHDFNVDANLLLYRMFWHGLFGQKNLDFYGGTAAYMGSVNQGSWLLLNKFADKDILFLRLIYYLI